MKRIEQRERRQARSSPARAKRIAQGFGPGMPGTMGSPCKGDRHEQFVISTGGARCEEGRSQFVNHGLKNLTFDSNNKPRAGSCVTNSGALTGRDCAIMLPRAEALGCTLSPHEAVPHCVFCGLSLELFARPVITNKTVLPKAAVTAGKIILRLKSERGQRGSPRRAATISLERRVVSKQ
jgi:hypothetical protein